jgi:hypothetical protein
MTLTAALARQFDMATLRSGDEPVALLSPDDARAWRAVALDGSTNGHGTVPVAIADPTTEDVGAADARLGRPVELRLCDEATLDAFLNRVSADADAEEVTRALRESAPELSGSTRPPRPPERATIRPRRSTTCTNSATPPSRPSSAPGASSRLGVEADSRATSTGRAGQATARRMAAAATAARRAQAEGAHYSSRNPSPRTVWMSRGSPSLRRR